MSKFLRLLLVMEQCNPLWPSVPRVAWNWYDNLRTMADVTLVTHARNREGLTQAAPGGKIDFIEESDFIRRYYAVIGKLTAGGGTNWPLLHALSFPLYAEFDRAVHARYAPEVLATKYDAVLGMTPILPRYPYSLAKLSHRVPFILGPVNGGLPYPKAFQKIAFKEFAQFNFLRAFGRLIPNYRETYQRASLVLAGSHHTRQFLETSLGVDPKKLVWVPENGVSESFFTPRVAKAPDAPLRVIFAGRMVPYKGADMLVEAFADACYTSAKPLELEFVGDGPEEPKLREMVARFGIADKVTFTGRVAPREVPARLQAADVFAFPSIREFGGAVVLEALAAGLPCVVADHGGIGEFVTPACGVKISPSSRAHLVSEFSRALRELAERPRTLREMSEAAVGRAREFTWESKSRQLLEMIGSTCQQAKSQPQAAA